MEREKSEKLAFCWKQNRRLVDSSHPLAVLLTTLGLLVVMFWNMKSCVLVVCSNILCCQEYKVSDMWIELLLCIRGVLVSNPETGNTDGIFVDIVNP
jgi:hypothetical protein